VEGLLRINALEEVAGTRCVYGEKYHAIVPRVSEDIRWEPSAHMAIRASANTLREPQAIHVATANLL